jgi:hypothetical protein
MATKRPNDPNKPDRDPEHKSGHEPKDEYGRPEDRKFEHDKGNASHLEIEERRFRGGLPPTPELYARAREQWNQLPGAVMKSPMDQTVPSTPQPPENTNPDEDDEHEEKR